jgi:hypothetical protein
MMGRNMHGDAFQCLGATEMMSQRSSVDAVSKLFHATIGHPDASSSMDARVLFWTLLLYLLPQRKYILAHAEGAKYGI